MAALAVRARDPVLDLQRSAGRGERRDGGRELLAIVGVGMREDELDRRSYGAGLDAEDAVQVVGPQQLVLRGDEVPAAGLGEPLTPGQQVFKAPCVVIRNRRICRSLDVRSLTAMRRLSTVQARPFAQPRRSPPRRPRAQPRYLLVGRRPARRPADELPNPEQHPATRHPRREAGPQSHGTPPESAGPPTEIARGMTPRAMTIERTLFAAGGGWS
jgi:hypothetical protein